MGFGNRLKVGNFTGIIYESSLPKMGEMVRDALVR